MNLFQKYGIKEVADVTFYSINRIGDEEIYTPVLFLDTLKVSTIEKSAEKVNAQGGYGNKKLIAWNFGKEITLNLEDALFTPASMSMIWGGELSAKLSKYTSLIAKINIANKYGELHYSTKAYPSPNLTNEEWELLFQIHNNKYSAGEVWKQGYFFGSDTTIESNRETLRQQYIKRNLLETIGEKDVSHAISSAIIKDIIEKITELKRIGTIETEQHDVEVIDRMERCIVKSRDGFTISTKEQFDNLQRYYQDDKTSSYTIYYDPKTMLPLLNLTDDGQINRESGTDEGNFTIKIGTVYLKWTRTVKYKTGENDGILGRTLVIDADTFPETYKIVGETYIREQKTGKDQRYQFIIHRAQVSSDTSITLEADGDPTTFSMTVDVLTPPNDIMMELVQYDVDEDIKHGGTYITPTKSKYTYTPASEAPKTSVGFENPEIY